MSREYVYETSNKDIIRITTFGNDNFDKKKCLFFVHGFKGFKDWGFGPYLGKYLADKGFFVVTFNFSHNGVGENFTEFTELEKFAENTISLEIAELSELIAAYEKGFFGNTKVNKIGVIGHSRGGGVSILNAVNNNSIDALCTWSAVSTFDRYTDRQKTEWKQKGFFEALNSRTNQMMRMNLSYLEDVEKNKNSSLDFASASHNLKIPWLIIHGEQDLAVPVDEAKKLYAWSQKDSTDFMIVPSTGHTFDITHPFQGSNSKFERVLDVTSKFFSHKLK
ncbi:MAG: prolyl oligopeptidase family serine peptidase [Ignavibacteriae bacterium]|nr:alpha/beta hydrolase [Ignavibacteriota bacterium]NOG98684.1 prolyl oligopeptidase family serine peptidase [Ignavibacteriota bacterium]